MRTELASAALGVFLLALSTAPAAAQPVPCELRWGSDLKGNTCFGANTLSFNSQGNRNSAFGLSALGNNTAGVANTGVGEATLVWNKSGNQNTALGSRAAGKQTGNNNTSLGTEAGWRGDELDGVLITGNDNIAVGFQAGSQWSTGSNNIAIGAPGTFGDAATVRIGVQNVQTKTFIAGIFGAKLAKRGPIPVLIDTTGQLGTIKSSIRYKEDIQPIGGASDALMKLRPVTFRYRQADADGAKPLQYGLIAEEVEEVMPDLVVRNEDGSAETVAYHVLPSLLLNEYQKQNRELAETKARLAAMENEMAAMKLALSRLAASGVRGGSLASFAP